MNIHATDSAKQITTRVLLANTLFRCSGETKLNTAVNYNLHSACRFFPDILVCFSECRSKFYFLFFGINIDFSDALVYSNNTWKKSNNLLR